MGFLKNMWQSICKFFLGMWDAFCTMIKGIVKFIGTAWEFLADLFDNIFDLIADGICVLFVLLLEPADENTETDPLMEQLGKQINGAIKIGKIPKISVEELRVAAKVDKETNKVIGYKAYEIDSTVNDSGMKEIEKCLKKEMIVEIGS